MIRQDAQRLLEKISLNVHCTEPRDESSQYSAMWKEFLDAKGVSYCLDEMLQMRTLEAVVTRGFGLDRRFSPSFDLYRDEPLYQEILAIPESDFGGPEKLFCGIGQEKRSGIFLRNACYAYEIIRGLGRKRDEVFTILEIGPGFGMLAYILKNYFPNARIVLVDLPESLTISAWYLENTLPGVRSLYLPSGQGAVVAEAETVFINAGSFKQGLMRYDLVINCDSMSEMTAVVASHYLEVVASDMNEGGVFFSLNKEGIDKEAMARPTLYPFPEKWAVEGIGSTYVGFLNDARHVRMSFRCSLQGQDQPPWRNRFLDLSYQYFYKTRLECFEMFAFLESLGRGTERPGQAVGTFFQRCLVEPDLEYFISSWRSVEAGLGMSAVDRSFFRLTMVMALDLMIEGGRMKEAAPVVAALGNTAGSFDELWTAGRLSEALGDRDAAQEFWLRAVKQAAVPSNILLKAGISLAAAGREVLSRQVFERVVQESPYALERIEAALRHKMDLPLIERLCAGLPAYILSNGYCLVRLAMIFHKNGHLKRAQEMLQPIVTRRIETGHYDLLAAVKILDAVGDGAQADSLMREAVKLGHNDNGFYRRVGLFFEGKNDLSRALEYLHRSVEIDVSWASTHYDLARIYGKQGRTDLELVQLKKALALSYNKEVDYDQLRQRMKALEGAGNRE